MHTSSATPKGPSARLPSLCETGGPSPRLFSHSMKGTNVIFSSALGGDRGNASSPSLRGNEANAFPPAPGLGEVIPPHKKQVGAKSTLLLQLKEQIADKPTPFFQLAEGAIPTLPLPSSFSKGTNVGLLNRSNRWLTHASSPEGAMPTNHLLSHVVVCIASFCSMYK